jgi:hypothetical protein
MNIIPRNSSTDLNMSKSAAWAVTAEECKANAYECLRLRNIGKISDRRACVLMAMMTSWILLANQIEKHEAILKEEAADRAAQ